MTMTLPAGGRVAILGGGLQGCATAYYLKARGVRDVCIIERAEIAAAASGKGGGFLAAGWGDGGPTEPLHRASFALHEELADALGLASFRRLPTLSVRHKPVSPMERLVLRNRLRQRGGVLPAWLDGDEAYAGLLDADTAQVAPAELCRALFAASGARLVRGAARGLELVDDARDGDDAPRRCAGVCVLSAESGRERVVACDAAVVALGPWSGRAQEWISHERCRVPIEGVLSTSLVLDGAAKPSDADGEFDAAALFCAEDARGCHLEVFPRPDGSVYVCGAGDSDTVRGAALSEGGEYEDASRPAAKESRVAAALASLASLAPTLMAGVTAHRTAACMRPLTPDAVPLIGRAPGASNVLLATGHNCWGILWAPITGKIVAEMLVDGAASCVPDECLRACDPARFASGSAADAALADRGRGRQMRGVATGQQW